MKFNVLLDEEALGAVLCFVRRDHAAFTTQALDKQWGDDWNDAPYEHNAEWPYGPRKGEDFRIVDVVFGGGDFEEPCAYYGNSPYSVDDINSGRVPWLRQGEWVKQPVEIYAGTTLRDFMRLIKQAGGRVYVEAELED